MKNDLIKNSIIVTKECVDRDLCEANIYHSLMFNWNNKLVKLRKFDREFSGLFNYVRDAIETKYILALGKIFGNSNEASLLCLIFQAKDLSEDFIQIKLERQNDIIRRRAITNRKEFLNQFETYKNKIIKIGEKISPYRNIQRAHNNPWRNSDGKETRNQVHEWLTFAESVYVQAMKGICESCGEVGEFYPSALNGEIDYFVSVIESGLK